MHHLSGLSAGPIAGASSLSQSPVRGAAALATTLETSPTQEPSGRDRLSGRSRPPSPLKAGLRHRETLDTGADSALFCPTPTGKPCALFLALLYLDYAARFVDIEHVCSGLEHAEPADNESTTFSSFGCGPDG